MVTRFRCNHVFICADTVWFHSPVTHATERAAHSSAIRPLASQQSQEVPAIPAFRSSTAFCHVHVHSASTAMSHSGTWWASASKENESKCFHINIDFHLGSTGFTLSASPDICGSAGS